MKALFGAAILFGASGASAGNLVLNCNEGAAIIYKVGDQLNGRIFDPAAVAAFVRASETVSEVRDAAGHVYNVKKSFPPGMMRQDNYLEVQNLVADSSGTTFCNGSSVGACFDAYETGYDFVAVGGQVMPSQSPAIWFINRWWFDTCESY